MWQRILKRLFPTASPGGLAAQVGEPAPAEALAPSPGPAAPLVDELEAELEEDPTSPGAGPWPPGMSLDALVERQVEDARRRGVFNDLAGAGKPLPDMERYDPDWWIRRKLADEGASVPLSPALELRRDLPLVLEGLRRLRSEADVRAGLAALNTRIRHVNAHHVAGPPSNLMPLDLDEWVRSWRAGRSSAP